MGNLMERGGTGFQTIMKAYVQSPEDKAPSVTIYPGFLSIKLFDRLYEDDSMALDFTRMTNEEKLIAILKMYGPEGVKSLQEKMRYYNRGKILCRGYFPSY